MPSAASRFKISAAAPTSDPASNVKAISWRPLVPRVMTVAGATGGSVVAGGGEDEVGAGADVAVVDGAVGAGAVVAVVEGAVGAGAVVAVVEGAVGAGEVGTVTGIEVVVLVAVDGVAAVVDPGATSTWREQPVTSTPRIANHATTLRCPATVTILIHLHSAPDRYPLNRGGAARHGRSLDVGFEPVAERECQRSRPTQPQLFEPFDRLVDGRPVTGGDPPQHDPDLFEALEPLTPTSQVLGVHAAVDVVRQRLDRRPGREVDEDRVVGKRSLGRRIPLLGLEPPHEPRTLVGEGVDGVECLHELGDERRVGRHHETTDVELGQIVFTHRPTVTAEAGLRPESHTT